jgi:thiol:disulfide interchange protein DsbD
MIKRVSSTVIYCVVILFTFLCSSSTVIAQALRPVKWDFKVASVTADEATLVFTATLDDGWHIYSQFLAEDGPLPTTFTFAPSKDYTLVGKVKEESPGVKSYNEIFMMDIVWFEKTAVFVQKVKLKTTQTTVKGKVEFMVCTEEMCLPGEAVPFSLDVK